MNLTIFGSGYVGLVTGACMAEMGNHVVCVDIDQDKIDRLNGGDVPIYEPGLDEYIARNRDAGRLEFTTDVARGVDHGLFQFVAVGTPPDEDGSADLKHVLAVARSIGQHMSGYRIIVNKSTVPVGTADKVGVAIQEELVKRDVAHEFDVVSNPEFLKEGAAIGDFMKPDRIIVGTSNPRTTELLRALYEPFNRNHDRMITMDVRSAELTKYASNAMLATKISFMNELANIAERVGADIEHVRVGMGSDPRIGYHFIYPGAGYGGSCFPKDVRALAKSAARDGYTATLMEAVEAVNLRQKNRLFEKISSHYKGELSGKTIALWGLSFKPKTDDMREASSRVLMESLWDAGANVRAYDPEAMDATRRLYPDADALTLCESAREALQGADALAIVTEWQEFRSPDFSHMKQTLTDPVIFDGRNLYDPQMLSSLGITYYGIGRGESVKDFSYCGPDRRSGRPAAD
ncbi:MAG: UDP-glucose/GDP-mannose dehydrogenase family protein [Proteobacteria bacterium]|nr:UDP-glucose/GDP-mannose dehydrogenase family protein [Pseudomonadota bacterium]MDA0995231.1 UDP-glucose/GDP-mannose dehydrogenase family protein [Pseudomonadota bacterium]